jgi:hypothetical protein
MYPRLVLCLLILAVSGAACSARSLLTISLTAENLETGATMQGNPRIEIDRPTGGGSPIKIVDKIDGGPIVPIIVLDNGVSERIGIYVASNVEGPVVARVEVLDGTCVWTGVSPTVSLNPGEESSTAIGLEASSGDCTAGRTDSGVSADAAMEDGGLSDVGSSDTVGENCQAYCDSYLATCGGQISETMTGCVTACTEMDWKQGTSSGPTTDNTFGCRLVHLRAAASPALRCSECPAASPDSFGVCGVAAPDGSTRDACP